LTIAVAFTTDGMALPKTWGFSGSFNTLAPPVEGGTAGFGAVWAKAAVAAANAIAASAYRERARKPSEPAATYRNPLFVKEMCGSAFKPLR
jgi:hypothetical protein